MNLRIALAQYAMRQETAANAGKAIDLISAAAHRGSDLIVFPELCVTPFFPQYPKRKVDHLACTLEDELVGSFQHACRGARIAAMPNLYLNDGGRLFDASLLIDREGNILGTSKMVHIAQLPKFFEKDYYSPSDSGFRVYETDLGKIGIVVCFDRHFPESIRTCALRGASLVVIPTANTVDEPRDIFECELRAAAFQNGVFVAMCNRVGEEDDMVFCGESIVVDPHGQVVAKAGATEELILAEIDLEEAERARRMRPYLSLRRVETYA